METEVGGEEGKLRENESRALTEVFVTLHVHY